MITRRWETLSWAGRRCGAAFLAALLVGGSMPVAGAATSSVKGAARQAAGTVLYQASFAGRQGLKGWIATEPGIASLTGGGMLAQATSSDLEVLAPYVPNGVHDYSVRAAIKKVGPGQAARSGFGVVVGGGLLQFQGIQGGIYHVDGPSRSFDGKHNEPMLQWLVSGSASVLESVAGNTVHPRFGYNTFRLDVHGSDYTLFVDGRQIVDFSIADAGSARQVGIWALNQGVQVNSFQVVKLAAAPPLPATPPLKAFNLSAKDVPRSFQWFGGHYWTNTELSRANKVATLQGFRLGYLTSYGDLAVPSAGPYYVSSFVYADASPQVAQGFNARNLAGDRQQNAGQPGYQTAALTGLGDVARVVTYDHQDSGGGLAGFKATGVDIYFSRGSYQCAVFEQFIAGSMTRTAMIAQARALAKIIVVHIR